MSTYANIRLRGARMGDFFTKSNEHPSVHSTAEIKKLILRLVIPAKAGIHCVADIFMQSLRGNRYPPARV